MIEFNGKQYDEELEVWEASEVEGFSKSNLGRLKKDSTGNPYKTFDLNESEDAAIYNVKLDGESYVIEVPLYIEEIIIDEDNTNDVGETNEVIVDSKDEGISEINQDEISNIDEFKESAIKGFEIGVDLANEESVTVEKLVKVEDKNEIEENLYGLDLDDIKDIRERFVNRDIENGANALAKEYDVPLSFITGVIMNRVARDPEYRAPKI